MNSLRKIKGSLFLKVIAVLLCVLSLFGFIVSSGYILLFGLGYDREKFDDEILYVCQRQYSKAALADTLELDDSYQKELENNENFKYAVLRAETDNINEVNLLDPSLYLKGSPDIEDKYTQVYWDRGQTVYTIELNSFMKAVINDDNVYGYSDGYEVLSYIVYEESTGHFYLSTEDNKLYLVPAISLDDKIKGHEGEIFTACEGGYKSSKGKRVITKKDLVFSDPELLLHDSSGRTVEINKVNRNFPVESVNNVSEYEVSDSEYILDEEKASERNDVRIHNNDNYFVLSYVDRRAEPKEGGMFDQAFSVIDVNAKICDNILLINIVSLVILCISTVYLVVSAGHNGRDDQVHINFFDKIPFGITTMIVGCIYLAVILVFVGGEIDIIKAKILVFDSAFGLLFIAIVYLLSIVRKLKARCFWRYTLIGMLMNRLSHILKLAWENISAVGKFILFLLAMLGADLIAGFVLGMPLALLFNGAGVILAVALIIIADLIPFIYAISQMTVLQKKAQNIAEGKLDEPLDTSKMYWEFKKHGDYLNRVSEGINLAVNEKMKSERFRTELITNVSHDIKTPLTSIINYVDLIKKEDVNQPPLDEYIEVLDRQSARLKKLIEDLMEASKASTGNISVDLERLNVGVFVSQIVGEFEEKLNAKNLELVISKPEEDLEIMADGRHFWRVIDNLMGNICKYSQSGTRVYVNIEGDSNTVTLTFLNTSAYQLNISSEELMERFVRGDSSRNTEGSGLGLSIASSLTSLMGGELKIDIVGDLFKATIVFNK